MINIDDRILTHLEPNELWLLIHIVKRLNKEHTAFPSKRTLLNDTRWKSEKTLTSAMNALVNKGVLSVTTRTREDGSQTSNLYRVTTSLIGVYKPANELQDTVKDTVGGVQKIQGGGVQKIQPPRGKKIQGVGGKKYTPNEVLSNQVLRSEVLNNEVFFSENEFSEGEIGDAAKEFETYGEPSPIIQKEKKKAPPSSAGTPPRPATLEHQMLEAYASFMEQKGIPVSRNKNGHVQFDKRAYKSMKDWATWAEGMPNATDTINDWQQFLEAAWATGDKWLLANFEPNILYSKRTNIVTAIGAKQAKAAEMLKSDGFIEKLLGW